MTEELKTNRRHQGWAMKSLISILLVLSLVLTSASVGTAATKKQAAAPEWKLHYNYLTDDEKLVYDGIDRLYSNFNIIDMTFEEFESEIDNNSDTPEKLANFFNNYIERGMAVKVVTKGNYNDDDGENTMRISVRNAYMADHPLDMRVQLSNYTIFVYGRVIYLCNLRDPVSRDYDALQQEANSAYEKTVAEIRSDERFEEGNQAVKELIISDYLCSKVKYNLPKDGDNDYYDAAHSTYGPLVLHRGVCEGIALLTCLLNNTFKIETNLLVSEGHAWNMVKLDDEYYELDNTMGGAQDYGILTHSYFNITSKAITGDDDGGMHTREFIFTRLPEATGTKYNYAYVWELAGRGAWKPAPADGVYPTKKKIKKDGFEFELNKDGTALLQTAGKKSGKATIPPYVEYQGWMYKVTEITPWSFKKCKKLKTLIIPRTVEDIDDYAFKNCGKLSSITLGWPHLSGHSLAGIKKGAHIYVQCAQSEFAELKSDIKHSGAKKPVVERAEHF